MNKYAKLRQRQQEEFNALPLGFAFGQKQFDEMMRGWGLDPEKDIDKIYSIGAGGYVQKKDAELLHETHKRLDEEIEAAIAADETGEGFIYEMFLYELDNHEFGYTMDTEDTPERPRLHGGAGARRPPAQTGYRKGRHGDLQEGGVLIWPTRERPATAGTS